MTIAFCAHPDCLKHDTGPGHAETADRLRVILETVKKPPLVDKLAFLEAPLAEEADLLPAHDKNYVQSIFNAEPGYLDPDTIFSAGSLQAALRAAGAGCAAVDDVMAGKYKSAFCAVRPPGHHATRDQAMGFCLFNNIAVAAFRLLQKHGIGRLAIVDFDVHHGNGTQDIVMQEPRILFISTHEMPLYPGTGHTAENREGHILNLPMPAGTDGNAYRALFERKIVPEINHFKPDFLLVSAGFDAHLHDPLAGICLVENDYRWLGTQLAALAQKHCQGRMVSFLEGGYNLEHLPSSVAAYLEGLDS